MNDKIEWGTITGFPNYYVSNFGEIYSTFKKGAKSLRKDKDGYLLCDLSELGQRQTIRVHRLVAQAFCKNDANHPIVDHVNGDKSDNSHLNLRWVDYSTNNTNRHICKGTSGLIGICKRDRKNPWQAYITKNGVFKSLGHFKTQEDAVFARESELVKRGVKYEAC